MNVSDIMIHNVISITPDARISDAAELMLRSGISGLPVIAPDGALVGILTEGDFLRYSRDKDQEAKRRRLLEMFVSPRRLEGECNRARLKRVGDLMTKAVHSIDPAQSVSKAAEL